jgi:F-type H+-transporting ATPase subunit a
MLATFVYDKIAVSYLGSNGSKYFPFIPYVFYVILFGNSFGLIPGVFSITSNLSFTLYMSSICRVGIFLMGIYINGVKFFRLSYPTMVPFVSSPFLMSIEVISFVVRLASLPLRLFANIVAGHILIETVSPPSPHIVASTNTGINIEYVIGSIVSLFMVSISIIFESLIAFPQAYIFAAPMTIYMHDVFAQH